MNEVVEEDPNPILNVTAPNDQSLGTIDYKTMNQYFDNMAWIDSIDIFSGLQVFKCKLYSGAGANVMSLKTYREVNASEFDGEGNCVPGFNNDMTILKGYTGTTIKQHGVRGINCFWDGNFYFIL